tara:strand:- start:454 stop:672 length:219 start_codon:yes stop_codon:yes gene_type:complete
MIYVRFQASLRNVKDLLHERGVDLRYESVRYWWQRFGSKVASEITKLIFTAKDHFSIKTILCAMKKPLNQVW